MNRNVWILTWAQAFAMTGAPVVILLGGLIGHQLAPQPAWATLPVAIMVVGTALASIPAALLMQQIGRKAGFIMALLLAASAALGAAWAIAQASFWWFCLAVAGIGVNQAFVQQYRFAAAESVDDTQVGKAVSLVLLAGILSALLGPEMAKRTAHWLDDGVYSGSFVGLACLQGVAALIVWLGYRNTIPDRHAAQAGTGRSLSVLLMQPGFLVAMLAAAVAYGVMSFIMTATPVSMHVRDGLSLEQTAWVIQSHIIAMFLPSLFTGQLLARFGIVRLMSAGVALLSACVVLSLLERHLLHYWWALVLLGMGWNFLFVGGTSLLTRCYRPTERFKAQAANDFVVFGLQALASLSAGTVIHQYGWQALNLLCVPALMLMGVGILWLRRQSSQAALE